MKFNEKLKSLREAKGYTQDEIASKLSIARQSVSKWEQGINEPDFDTTKKLCQILDCSLDDLIDDDKDISTSKEQKDKKTATRLFKISLFVLLYGVFIVFSLIAVGDNIVVTHLNMDGTVTLGSKWFLLFGLIPLVIYFGVLMWANLLTKRNQYYRKHLVSANAVFLGIAIFLVAFVSTILALSIKDHHREKIALFNLVPALVLGLLTSVGPFTHPRFNKRNAFFGFRTNFTMSNEEGWNKVNSFASIALTIAGLLCYVLVLIFMNKEWAMFFISGVVLAIIPALIYHEVVKKQQQSK